MELKIDNARVDQSVIKKTKTDITAVLSMLKEVVSQHKYETEESFINLPFDEGILEKVKKVASEKVGENLKYIIVVGIGGSNLGTKAIYDAIYGHFDLLNLGRYPKIIFVDTNNSETLSNLKKFLNAEIKNPSEIIINVISKSGNTTETLFNTEFIAGILFENFGDISDRFVVTTNKNSALWKESEEKGITLLSIPEKVGGRYSVFSTVGLFPLAIANINIARLLDGAKEMRAECLNEDISDNPAVLSAITLFLNYKNGRIINDNFFFNSELESMGKWYRQLMGESIGKDEKGITPTVSIGSTDLHSVGQLYLGGVKDKIVSFVNSKKVNGNSIKAELFPELAGAINGKSAQDIMSAIFEGVKTAYKKREVPFIEVTLPDITPKSIGEFMQFKMMEMVYLGALLGVSVFNQPDVEAYKEETRRILNEN